MLKFVMTASVIAAPVMAFADGAHGTWKTNVNDAGGYLEVTIAPCAADASKTCGLVTRAFKAGVEDPRYQYVGKPIIENMTSDGGGRYSGGTVFDPENGKTYKSKMSVDGDTLDVEGCVAILCEGEVWSRVK